MLVATRDSLPRPGAPDAPLHGRIPAREAGAVTRAARFMTVLQMAGSLLAIPVGLASAYSIYRANFSPETACQNLRANIVGMIDKKIDAGTRRMLVGRDVETFEKTCAAVDPDAVAAFKTLLSAEKAPAIAHAAVPAKENLRKAEPRPAVAVKREPAPAPAPARPAAPQPAQPHDTAVSDTKWLAAVRGALVAPEHSRIAPPPSATPLAVQVPPATDAPALPPPTAVTSVPAQPPAVDHPVPPAAIPEMVTASTAKAAGFLSHIPFIGQALAR